jgi:uncharacterized OB-fold protein
MDAESRPFWEGCRRHELVLQRCADCGTVRHRPRALCPACLSGQIEWIRASGRGAVYSFTVTHQNQAPAFRRAVPYVLAYVELEEGVRMLTNVVGCEPGQVRVGMPVQVEFVDLDEERSIPRFRPA